MLYICVFISKSSFQCPSTLDEEKSYNPFLRVHLPGVLQSLEIENSENLEYNQLRTRALAECRRRKDQFKYKLWTCLNATLLRRMCKLRNTFVYDYTISWYMLYNIYIFQCIMFDAMINLDGLNCSWRHERFNKGTACHIKHWTLTQIFTMCGDLCESTDCIWSLVKGLQIKYLHAKMY